MCYFLLSGWTSRQQFEETWAALLGVISSPPLPDTVSTEVCVKFVFLKLYDIEICWENIMHSCLILLKWRPNLVRILRTQWTTTKFDFKHFLSNFSVCCKNPWWYRLATFADFPSEPCMSSRRTAVEAWDRLHAWFIFFFWWIANVFQTFVCDYCFVVLPI